MIKNKIMTELASEEVNMVAGGDIWSKAREVVVDAAKDTGEFVAKANDFVDEAAQKVGETFREAKEAYVDSREKAKTDL
jgi:hypothetical protein